MGIATYRSRAAGAAFVLAAFVLAAFRFPAFWVAAFCDSG
jgi:hypothetical protein